MSLHVQASTGGYWVTSLLCVYVCVTSCEDESSLSHSHTSMARRYITWYLSSMTLICLASLRFFACCKLICEAW